MLLGDLSLNDKHRFSPVTTCPVRFSCSFNLRERISSISRGETLPCCSSTVDVTMDDEVGWLKRFVVTLIERHGDGRRR